MSRTKVRPTERATFAAYNVCYNLGAYLAIGILAGGVILSGSHLKATRWWIIALLVGAWVSMTVRARFLSVTATSAGLRIVNPYRVVTLPWGEIREISEGSVGRVPDHPAPQIRFVGEEAERRTIHPIALAGDRPRFAFVDAIERQIDNRDAHRVAGMLRSYFESLPGHRPRTSAD